jgi:DNA mismatch endonuclease (patch repair protein)
MVERLSPEARSRNMARILGKDTSPEMIVRRLLHTMGYRYRLHARTLPGRPDLVFPSKRKAIFVNGCFWHRHQGCRYAYRPKSRVDFWDRKFAQNVERDGRNLRAFADDGWEALVVWQCEIADVGLLRDRLGRFLGPTKAARAA